MFCVFRGVQIGQCRKKLSLLLEFAMRLQWLRERLPGDAEAADRPVTGSTLALPLLRIPVLFLQSLASAIIPGRVCQVAFGAHQHRGHS